MEQKSRLVETHDQAVLRLAALAEERGIRIYVYPQTGEHYASSISTPGLLHRVTLWSCDCPGFCRYGRCSHHSALLAGLRIAVDLHAAFLSDRGQAADCLIAGFNEPTALFHFVPP